MQPITTLYAHNHWANLRLVDICAALSAAEIETTSPGAYGTIQETLQHIAQSERSYFARISTGQPYNGPDEPTLSLAQIREILQVTGQGLIEWAARIGADETVTVNWLGTPREVPKSIIMAQVLDHAIEHRTQIQTILTQLGLESPDLQPWVFFDEQGN